MGGADRYSGEGPGEWGLFVMAAIMRETNEFFDEQAKQCRANAKRASNKSDRDFWLRLAQRWEELLRIREHEATDAHPVRKYSFGRTRFTKRHAA